MRFIENGPDVPDELLIAHDEGQVIFFCGSGVSRAYAGLPDFDGLAQQVLDKLRVDQENEVRKFYTAAKRVEAEAGVSGVFSADRVFTLLGRHFGRRLINQAVAESLKCKTNKQSLLAHKTLLNLARVQNGPLRLVTTNFDLLFEAAQPDVSTRTCSNLSHVEFNDDAWGGRESSWAS